MITYEQIKSANERVARVEIRGKNMLALRRGCKRSAKSARTEASKPLYS